MNINSFRRHNLDNIRSIFEEEAGVSLTSRKGVRRPLYTVLLCAALLVCCLTATAVASGLFSGDDLSLSSVYEGDGVVTVTVENRSDKPLRFEETLRLMRWSTGELIQPLSDGLVITGTNIAPHSTGTLTIDLSGAYDIALLEQPLTNDHYYFILTNNNFVFGHDWICSVTFAEPIAAPVPEAVPPQPDAGIVQSIIEELQFYFETITFEIPERNELQARYLEACSELFAQFDGTIVPSVSPWLLVETGSPDTPPPIIYDESVPVEEQYLLIGQHHHTHDANLKLLGGSPSESALTISASLPLQSYAGASTYLPLLYIFTYEKEAAKETCYAFLHGQLFTFAELEQYKVYEDGQYVCYEVSPLIYSDLRAYAEDFAAWNPDVRFDEQVWSRVQTIHTYLTENLPSLLYRQTT